MQPGSSKGGSVPERVWQMVCDFYSYMRQEALSFVQLPQTEEWNTESELWKLPLSWERRQDDGKRSEPEINSTDDTYAPPSFTSHMLIAFQMKPYGTAHMFSIFVNLKKKPARLFLI